MDEKQSSKPQATPIAVTNWRDIRKVFGIKEKNRRGHMYIIGKTGTGKSSLIANMALSDIRAGNGIGLLDPHGDLSEDILNRIPKERIDDVVYFNPADLEYPIGFNPLQKVPKDKQHLIVSGIISVFRMIWSEFWGPRLEHILRYSLFTLLEYPGSTLLDLPRLLTDPAFRKEVLAHLSQREILSFWFNEFDKYSAWLRSEVISPILNKVGQFLVNLPLRNIIGQTNSTFDLAAVMDGRKILIANLAKGKIGEDNTSVLGSLLLTEIWLKMLERAETPERERIPFYLYVDEFHSFITLSFAAILSESRKYGLNMVMANQYLTQLDEKVRDAIFGNVGSIISFRVGAEDAKYLAREFSPFMEEDFTNLPNYNIYLRLMIDGVTSTPFSGTTLQLRQVEDSCAEEITRMSQKKHGTERTIVERDITVRRQRTSSVDNSQNRVNPDQKTMF
ncbi:MAG: TraM recognition domain-containing protein [Bacteroidetes bacterium]|jgi:hypothetical protein|nr:TraM recognition domain-containing protein [Bacteroidota bacterium]